jgi:DNA-binding CsgD family transcriptional regulator
MIVTDLALHPLAFDRGATEILKVSGQEHAGTKPGFGIPEEILESIRGRNLTGLPPVKAHFRSGGQEYSCRAFRVEPVDKLLRLPLLVLYLQREPSAGEAINGLAARYHLTDREQQALQGISMGFTSKEMAERMNISPNTVKAFIRLIRIKMGVSTRAAIVAKLLEQDGGGNGSDPA